jgi:hypothetical protein
MVCVGVGCGYRVFFESVKIACKGAFYIKKFQACKSGENYVGVDNTLLYH